MSEQPDIRQWAYGKWWTQPTETEDPQPLDPQPPPPSLDDLFDTRLLEE